MKIALSGAHGTGKTTLARALASEFDLKELPTPGRLMAAQGLPVNQDATVTSQCLAWLMQLSLESEFDDWISMRSLVDVWAYTALAYGRASPARLDTALFNEVTKATRLLLGGRYDVLFFLPPRIPLVADDVRSDDEAFQAAVDEKIREGLETWGVERIVLDVTDEDAIPAAVERVRRATAP
jgi:nicotinamide riboside kinase